MRDGGVCMVVVGLAVWFGDGAGAPRVVGRQEEAVHRRWRLHR